MPYNFLMRSYLPITICIFVLISTLNVSATTLGLGPGTIKVVTKNDDICSDGPYALMGEKDDQVLMLGPNITLFPPKSEKETITSASATECAEDVVSSLKDNTLTNIFSTHSCPKKLKQLERVVTEKLSVSKDKTLTYTKTSSGEKSIKCVFKWGPSEKK